VCVCARVFVIYKPSVTLTFDDLVYTSGEPAPCTQSLAAATAAIVLDAAASAHHPRLSCLYDAAITAALYTAIAAVLRAAIVASAIAAAIEPGFEGGVEGGSGEG